MAEENKKEPADVSKAEVVPASQAPAAVKPYPPEEHGDVVEGAVTPFEGDFMEITVNVAAHLAEYEKALDTILNFIIRRTYAGDWVSHDKDSTPIEERTANMIGAAAERVARDLGIQESNRTKPTKFVHEKPAGHYYFECEGDFTFRGRTVHAIGRASTTNPFHLGKAGGKVENIREEYLIQEAWRDCTKQGVKGLFGLRKIPIIKLQALGYDISKIKYVTFKTGENSEAKKNPNATAKPEGADGALSVTTTIDSILFRKWKEKDICDVTDGEGAKYSWWGKGEKSEEAQKLVAAQQAQKRVTIHYKNKDGKYNNIESVDVQP